MMKALYFFPVVQNDGEEIIFHMDVADDEGRIVAWWGDMCGYSLQEAQKEFCKFCKEYAVDYIEVVY